jgi:hypothetical protein
VKTGVRSIAKALKTLDSGFRRNDVKKNRTDFFTPSPIKGGGKKLIFMVREWRGRHEKLFCYKEIGRKVVKKGRGERHTPLQIFGFRLWPG